MLIFALSISIPRLFHVFNRHALDSCRRAGVAAPGRPVHTFRKCSNVRKFSLTGIFGTKGYDAAYTVEHSVAQ